MKVNLCIVAIIIALICCTKKQGKNPSLAFTDKSLLDSCKSVNYNYYKQDPVSLLSGLNGAHGAFKLRFNSIAYKALTDEGKIPSGSRFPEGSMLVKDVYRNGKISLYALMYKREGSWLWAEIEPGGAVHYSVNQNPDGCVNCHTQQGNRDLALSFHFY